MKLESSFKIIEVMSGMVENTLVNAGIAQSVEQRIRNA